MCTRAGLRLGLWHRHTISPDRVWRTCDCRKQILESCSGVRKNCMEYRHFEEVMNASPTFRDNFCLVPTKWKHLKRMMSTLEEFGGAVLSDKLKKMQEDQTGEESGPSPLGVSPGSSWKSPGSCVKLDTCDW